MEAWVCKAEQRRWGRPEPHLLYFRAYVTNQTPTPKALALAFYPSCFSWSGHD